jgi:hypothetical protein
VFADLSALTDNLVEVTCRRNAASNTLNEEGLGKHEDQILLLNSKLRLPGLDTSLEAEGT